MKFQNLFSSIAVFLLAAGAGSVFAEDGCDRRFIENQEFESLTVVGQSCYLQFVTIKGDLTVIDAGDFDILDSTVGGTVTLLASDEARVHGTKANKVIVKGNLNATVTAVEALESIRVVNNVGAVVGYNYAPIIRCKDNIKLVADENFATDRPTNCRTPGL